ncbi:hypothetical protein D3C72_2069590 [compost metagenome]
MVNEQQNLLWFRLAVLYIGGQLRNTTQFTRDGIEREKSSPGRNNGEDQKYE